MNFPLRSACLLALIFAIGCSRSPSPNDGNPQPVPGPAGPAGVAGAPGPSGTAGTNGSEKVTVVTIPVPVGAAAATVPPKNPAPQNPAPAPTLSSPAALPPSPVTQNPASPAIAAPAPAADSTAIDNVAESAANAAALVAEPLPENRATPTVWIVLHGDGKQALQGSVHISAAPMPSGDRAATQPPSGRYISVPIEIKNLDGQVTTGHFEFRHPTLGLIEPFHIEQQGGTLSDYVESKAVKGYKAFDLSISVPINGVTGEVFSSLEYSILALDLAKTTAPAETQKIMELTADLRIKLEKFNDLVLRKAYQAFVTGMTERPDMPGHLSVDVADRIRNYDELFLKNYLENVDNARRLRVEYEAALKDAAAQTTRMQLLAANQPVPPPPPQTNTGDALADARIWPLTSDAAKASPDFQTPNRIKLVFVADGFGADEQEKFHEEAQKKWNYLFGGGPRHLPGVSPLREYRNYFVGVAVGVVSAQSGSCHKENGQTRCPSTAFGSFFGNFNIGRLLGITPEGTQRMQDLLRTRLPGADLAALIVNDKEYGGSGGKFAMVSLNDDANEVIAHELMGHSFAKLGDEYEDPYPGYPDVEEPNTTKDSYGGKWSAFATPAAASTTKPEFPFAISGGAHYHAESWYRPADNCKMRELGQPFCEVCKDAILTAIYNKVKPIETAEPPPGPVDFAAKDKWSLQITPMKPAVSLTFQWSVDGKPVPHSNTSRFTALLKALPADGKSHVVSVMAKDRSTMLRQTSSQALASQSLQWNVTLR